MIKQYKIVELDLETLEDNPENPRVMEKRKLRGLQRSMEEFGNLGILVYNERTKRLIAGNQRLKILKADGQKKAPGIAVDWPKEKEYAGLLELNNQFIQGEWQPDQTKKILDQVEGYMPEVYDNALMMDLKSFINRMLPKPGESPDQDVIPTMEIEPFEHWDYIVLVFRDSRDWLVACNQLGIKKVKFETFKGYKKIGLGRVLDGRKFLERIKGGLGASGDNQQGKG